VQGSLAQNSVQWAAFEDQGNSQWDETLKEGANSEGANGKRMREWAEDWEKFCLWVVDEFGSNV